MKEIKFRGKRVDTGEWVYGSNIHKVILNDTKEELWVIHPKGEPIEHLGDGYIKYRPPVVITESIGQYTGLKDKNGVEIYEGDILITKEEFADLINYEFFEKEVVNTVIYDNSNAMFTLYQEGWGTVNENMSELEVVGNIYENKELLND